MLCSYSGDGRDQVGRVAPWCRPAQLQRGRLPWRRRCRWSAAARLSRRLASGAVTSRFERRRGWPVLRAGLAAPRLPVSAVRPADRRCVWSFAGARSRRGRTRHSRALLRHLPVSRPRSVLLLPLLLSMVKTGQLTTRCKAPSTPATMSKQQATLSKQRSTLSKQHSTL